MTAMPKLTEGREYASQIPADRVKRHNFLLTGEPLRLPAVCPQANKHTPSRYERRLSSAPKSDRHPLAQQWRDSHLPCPIATGKGLGLGAAVGLGVDEILPYNGLMLSSGKPSYPLLPAGEPVLLLPAGETRTAEQLAVESIGTVDGYPVIKFLREFGVPMMSDLLNQGKIREVKDKLFIGQLLVSNSQLETETPPAQPDMTIQAQVLSAPVESRPTPDVVVPARVSPVAPWFKHLPSNQQHLNPPIITQPAESPAPTDEPKAVATQPKGDILGAAKIHKQLMRNNNEARTLARGICNDGEEIDRFLAGYGIHSGTPVTEEKLEVIRGLVVAEELKYASRVTLDTLDIYGEVIYGGMVWTTTKASGIKKYSKGRTHRINRLYEEEAAGWLEELKRKKLSPVQILQVGKRMEALTAGARNFGKRLQ